MDGADNQKPTKTTRVSPNKQAMGAHRVDHAFIMERQRDLHRTKGDDQDAHQHPRNRQIVKNAGNIREISEEKRQSHDQHANRNDNPSPFQDITEAAHGEAEKFSLFEAHTFYPS